jgi:sialate O-acetylesterase
MRPNPLFSDGCVLQQGISVPVWGTAKDGEKITVELQGQTATTTAKDGRWMVRLKPLKTGGPFTMTISGENVVEIRDVLVGEVWLAGGQSNMAWQLDKTDLAGQEIAASTDPELRFARVPMGQLTEPLYETPIQWRSAAPETSGAFSGVAYHFAQQLRRALGCPVGIIDNSRGGTRIEAWMSPEALEPFEGQFVREMHPPAEGQTVSPHTASTLYNAMTAPLIPYAIRGFIWYQGESNAHNAYMYPKLFPAQIADWRKQWGQGDVPFLFVQIAPWRLSQDQFAGSRWAEVREAQLQAAQTVPNTSMVVITDHGAEDAHPRHKKTVGERLALAARAVAYGEDIVYKSPYPAAVGFKGKNAAIEFENAEGGLTAYGEVKGFTLAGKDQVFHEAKAVIDGCRVVVTSDEVAKPVAVRYGWGDGRFCNLYNKAGLPASPFRSDDFPKASEQPE